MGCNLTARVEVLGVGADALYAVSVVCPEHNPDASPMATISTSEVDAFLREGAEAVLMGGFPPGVFAKVIYRLRDAGAIVANGFVKFADDYTDAENRRLGLN